MEVLTQRSKQLWSKEGDQNSKFFLTSAKARRKLNQIKMITDEEGRVVDWDTGLQDVMIKYFEDLFTKSDTEWDGVVNYIPQSIIEEQNTRLLRPLKIMR